ncbi:MAG: hypothetical protein Q7R64_00520 [bacterium]|nr:hypothetical protein [bacterium]
MKSNDFLRFLSFLAFGAGSLGFVLLVTVYVLPELFPPEWSDSLRNPVELALAFGIIWTFLGGGLVARKLSMSM